MTEIVRGDVMKYVLDYNAFHNLESIRYNIFRQIKKGAKRYRHAHNQEQAKKRNGKRRSAIDWYGAGTV